MTKDKSDNQDHYASFSLRLLARLFDSLLLWLVPLVILLWVVSSASNTRNLWVGILWFFWALLILRGLLAWVYYIGTFVKLGGSFGKILAGLRIELEDKRQPRVSDGLMRFLVGYTVSSLFWWLGFLWVLRDGKRKGFHDHFANTVVVRRERATNLIIGLPIIIGITVFVVYSIVAIGSEQGIWASIVSDVRIFVQEMQKISPSENSVRE